MRRASGEALALERAILERSGAGEDALARARLRAAGGPRASSRATSASRPFRRGVWVRFRLPKGAYATVVMREITKVAV
jgi:tRNA pseudouridine13 synthase